MAKKQQISKVIKAFNVEVFDGEINSLIDWLFSLKAEYPDYDRLYISANQHYDDVNIELVGHRLETDEEVRARDAEARQFRKLRKDAKNSIQAAKDELDRLEYERLK